MTIEKKYADRIDMRFRYTPAAATDVAKTIKAAIKKRDEAIAEAAAKAAEVVAEQAVKIRKLK